MFLDGISVLTNAFQSFQMGACFSKVFNGCPLKIHCTASWIDPESRGKLDNDFHTSFFISYTCHPCHLLKTNWTQILLLPTRNKI